MAKLAKERYLVLLVDDAAYDCLSIKVPGSQGGQLNFIGSISDGHDLIAYLQKTGESNEQAQAQILALAHGGKKILEFAPTGFLRSARVLRILVLTARNHRNLLMWAHFCSPAFYSAAFPNALAA